MRQVFVRKIGSSVCATLIDTGNFLMGKDGDAEAILDACGVTENQLPITVNLTDRFGLMLLTLGDEQTMKSTT